MRGANGGVNNTLETINAAAAVIAAAENRMPQAAVQKRRWGSWWSLYWCFGSYKSNKQIGHAAAIVPETAAPQAAAPAAQNPTQTLSIALPFVAPPSSPASFLQSEPPSSTQSPSGIFSLSSMTASMYSPGRPASMFAIGPYAYETQLVTPPVFSTFTTEPSTAPFTPPPESVHLTTPSSPEVPFARLLDPTQQTGETGQRFPLSQYEFQSYLLHPGSPISNLISPCSGISGSGTSSPFPDLEFAPSNQYFLKFKAGDHSKLLNLEKMSSREWGSQQGSGTLTPDAVGPESRDGVFSDRQTHEVVLPSTAYNGLRNDEIVVDHRVSFEITAVVVRCVEQKSEALPRNALASLENIEENAKGEERQSDMSNGHEPCAGENSNNASEKASSDGADGQHRQKHRSITLGSAKEFNFDNIDGGNYDKSSISSDWWTNEKVLGKEEGGTSKDWSFFPMMQPDIS